MSMTTSAVLGSSFVIGIDAFRISHRDVDRHDAPSALRTVFDVLTLYREPAQLAEFAHDPAVLTEFAARSSSFRQCLLA
jgi:hypothetical protein